MTGDAVRVAVDAFALSDGSELRGLGTFLRNVLGGLARQPGIDIVALARAGVAVPGGVERQVLRRHDLRPRLAHLEHLARLPGDLRRTGADVVWAPGAHPPRRCPVPLVQTLHDLTPLLVPHPLTAPEARRWQRSGPALRRASRVVAVSRSSADQGIRFLGLDPGRVAVVHHGIEPQFSPGPAPGSEPPYLLYVGVWGPHKGYAEAAAVVAALAEDGFPHRLRIAGPQDAWLAARAREAVDASPRPDRVDVLGWVDDLVGLYRGAAALVCTSRAEGFGFPLLEAMACGTPVVAFDNTAIPEVLGGAGLLVTDGDVGAFAAATARLLREPALAADLRAAGLERATAFRWDRAVEAYREILVTAAAGSA